MRLLPLICISLLAACGGHSSGVSEPKLAAEQAPEKRRFVLDDALPPAVYDNDAGIQLTIIALKPDGDEQQALIQFKGVRHPLSGKVLLATMEIYKNGDYAWRVRFHGELRRLVGIARNTRGSLKLQTTLTLPMTVVRSRMRYSSELTRELEFQTIVSKHERQVADGSLVALEVVPAFDLLAYKRAQESTFKYTAKKLADGCEGMPIKIDWSTVQADDSFEHFPCSTGAEILVAACQRSVYSASIVKAKTKRVVCSSGPKDGYSLGDNGTLTIVSSSYPSKPELQKEMESLYDFGRVVLKNNRGFVVLDPSGGYNQRVYMGNGTVFHKHRTLRNTLWGVRTGLKFDVKDGAWQINCGVDNVEKYEEILPAQAEQILAKATFGEQIWKRTPVALSRDSRGYYYYVDRLQDEFGGKDFRVYRGLRGRLQQTQLIDIIDDHVGRIFSTKQGQLRLLLNNDKSVWIGGKNEKQLTNVWKESSFHTEPYGEVATLIYKELGVYDGQDFGAICY